MNVYVDGWQSRLNIQTKAVVDIATPADAVQAFSNDPPAPALDAQRGSGFQGNAREGFQICAERKCAGADPELNTLY